MVRIEEEISCFRVTVYQDDRKVTRFLRKIYSVLLPVRDNVVLLA